MCNDHDKYYRHDEKHMKLNHNFVGLLRHLNLILLVYHSLLANVI
jgi:hypothetical protein